MTYAQPKTYSEAKARARAERAQVVADLIAALRLPRLTFRLRPAFS